MPLAKGSARPWMKCAPCACTKYGKPAGAADAGDGGDLLVPHLALFDQLEIKREHGEIAAAGAPRRMVGGDFLFGQAFAFVAGGGGGATAARLPARAGISVNGLTHS